MVVFLTSNDPLAPPGKEPELHTIKKETPPILFFLKWVESRALNSIRTYTKPSNPLMLYNKKTEQLA